MLDFFISIMISNKSLSKGPQLVVSHLGMLEL